MKSSKLQTAGGGEDLDLNHESKIPTAKIQKTTEPFPRLRKLALEIRAMVYVHEVGIAPGKQAPALLIALGTGGEEWEHDYDIARKLYRKHNFVLTVQNQKKFWRMPEASRTLIRHLYVPIDRDCFEAIHSDGNLGKDLDLHTARPLWQKQISTVTIEYTNDRFVSPSGNLDYTIFRMMGRVLLMTVASGRGVDKAVVVLRQDDRRKGARERFKLGSSALAHWEPLKTSVDGDLEVVTRERVRHSRSNLSGRITEVFSIPEIMLLGKINL
ncbi:hypothetical protein QTJ16_000590 [Diplocarpon rosae]|uniref:Uncharacterized protein n=1 Tax=Diplocarpon rosae TaxID=946125 RepID=A0AAD9T5K6_9HELO|nr:hypothetical protein QTJ16_000590 [Diplocarpon rosae]